MPTRKPLDTGLGSATDEAVPLYPTEPLSPYAAAWESIKDDIVTAFGEGQSATTDAQVALIEPGVRLLELSAAYREAHAAHVAARQATEASTGPREVWHALNAAADTAQSAMEAAKQALLSAALDIT